MTGIARNHSKDAACAGKVAFRSFALANAVSERKLKTTRLRQPYHCAHCGSWHIGGKNKVSRAKALAQRKKREATHE